MFEGMKVGAQIDAINRKEFGIRKAPPLFCTKLVNHRPHGRKGKLVKRACGGEIRVEGYILTRPEYGHCTSCEAYWFDDHVGEKVCPKCGWSPDHREGYGCIPMVHVNAPLTAIATN